MLRRLQRRNPGYQQESVTPTQLVQPKSVHKHISTRQIEDIFCQGTKRLSNQLVSPCAHNGHHRPSYSTISGDSVSTRQTSKNVAFREARLELYKSKQFRLHLGEAWGRNSDDLGSMLGGVTVQQRSTSDWSPPKPPKFTP